MQFSRCGEGWLLLDETAPPGRQLIATVGSPVEVVALKRLCETRLRGEEISSHFTFLLDELIYRATPYSDREGRLSIRIEGSDGSLHRIETEFLHPKTEAAP